MTDRAYIKVPCPWCNDDMSTWYVNTVHNEETSDYDLPELESSSSCRTCGNSVVVVGMTAPTITVTRGRSKEEFQLERLAAKARWKDQIVALKKKFPNRPNGSLKCRFFGHTWELLATSGYTSTLDAYKDKAFSLCVNCLTVLDTLNEIPDDYGYWCK